MQTLAVGTTAVKARFPGLGFSGKSMKPHLAGNLGMLVGMPSSGKSSILQSCPDAYVFNLDLSPTVTDLKATIWPGLDSSGRVIDTDGKPIELTWEAVLDKIRILIEMAKSGADRPAAVCFDSHHGLSRVLKPWIAKRYKKESFLDAGEAGWRDHNAAISQLPFDLKKYGYGVWYSCHLSKKYVQLSQELTEPVPELAMTDTLFKQLHPVFDIVAPVKKTIEEIRVPKIEELKDGAGNVLSTRQTEEIQAVHKHYIDFSDPQLLAITKGRNISGRIPFGVDEGWQKFEEAYKTSNPDAYT